MEVMYEYRSEIIRVIDGDTVVAKIDLGFNVFTVQTLRLSSIDAPEKRGKEKESGKASMLHLCKLVKMFTPIHVFTEKDKTGKYGRYLARLIGTGLDGAKLDLNMQMILDGYATRRN